MKQPLPKSTNSLKSINFNDRISYQERIEHFTNPIAKKLLGVMVRKQSNIAVSADVITKKELLALAEMVGPYICMLKTHIDIVHDFDQDLIDQLNQLAITHDFILFEDRKFADIGNTVQHQYSGGVYQISRWADVINAHLRE